MSKEAMKLALDRSEPSILSPGWTLVRDEDIAAMREALAEQPAQQDSTCSNALREQGKAYPRTCKKCGLGPCIELAQQALDKKAENARELGLDYEPSTGMQVSKVWWDSEKLMAKPIPFVEFYKPAQRTWVSLTDEQMLAIVHYSQLDNARAIEAKLKEMNT
jgi:hypothetical protein